MTIVAALLVILVLVFAIVRPRGLPEIVMALPAAIVVLLLSIVSVSQARREVLDLLPTVAFLAAILVLAHLADALGVFTWIASLLRSGAKGSPRHLLVLVFVAAALTTAVLSLDATVVLLTPAVIATARALRLPARPHSYATTHLSNSASTLLPVSNLTNLLAFSATGLSFLHFTALMALPWLTTIATEFLVFWFFFRSDLKPVPVDPEPAVDVPAPRAALIVIGVALLGFAVSGFVGVAPAWVAAVAALVLAVPALRGGRSTPWKMVKAADLFFCGFVLLLGIIVAGLTDGPIGRWLADILPGETTFVGLLATAAIAAVAANVVNNLPATLMLLAAFGTAAPPALLLAMVIGVNLGPNLTYVGSLATMLWRRVCLAADEPSDLKTFTELGLISTPLTIVVAVVALWLGLQV